jgi:subtilisin family serine protease
VLDSGIGVHPWLTESHVTRDPEVLGRTIGIAPAPGDAETTGAGDRFTGELEPDAGHGTFIAGLVRQACPDAHLLGVRLFRGDGEVTESDMLEALQLLALRHLLALEGRSHDGLAYEPLHVVSLSLGYYHEQPEDASFDALLHGPLALLGRYGVCVVASAGNDSTNRPSYPAAFAPGNGGLGDDESRLPVLTVGALNPDGTVALFSNDGPWVRFWRPGASLVSTLPTTFDGSEEALNVLVGERGETRAALDPDDFTAGFAVWSGTSFAAPVFAGQLADRLLDEMSGSAPATTPAEVVARTRAVLSTMPTVGVRP